VSADGRRFYTIEYEPSALTPLRPAQMVFVQNWIEELKRRVPTR
jgi:hypothetical protein